MLVNFPVINKDSFYQNPFNYDSFEANRTASLDQVDKLLRLKEKREKTLGYLYKCVLCKKKFNEIDSLKEHYELHKKSDECRYEAEKSTSIINCPACPAVFDKLANYNTHVKKKHQTKAFSCDECHEKFIDEYHLSVHAAKHTETPSLFTCCSCKEFSTYHFLELMTHLNYHSEGNANKFYCDGCDMYFMNETWFKDHKLFHVKQQQQRLFSDAQICYKCRKCNMTFPFRKNLIVHDAKLHAPPSKLCNVCGKVFRRQSLLNFHMKVHGEGAYACTVCAKTFKQSRGLTMHMRIHTGEKPYNCNLCEKSFSQKGSLNVHSRIHSGERPFPCGKCKKSFVTKTTRDTHQKACKNSF